MNKKLFAIYYPQNMATKSPGDIQHILKILDLSLNDQLSYNTHGPCSTHCFYIYSTETQPSIVQLADNHAYFSCKTDPLLALL